MSKNSKNSKFANRYTDETKARVVARIKELKRQGVTGPAAVAAREFSVSYPSATDWYRRAAAETHKTITRRATIADPQTEAENEAHALQEVMEEEGVSDHTRGGVHPLLTAYEDAEEKYDHQRSIVDTLHAELAVHSERLAELERTKNDAKKALVELVNSL